MSEVWYDNTLGLDPATPLEESLKALPARWAVYLMCDAAGQPVQMLAVKNLRASVKRRLSEDAPDALTKRVDYRAVVRQIRYRRVDSALESDLAYVDVARQVFPQTYRQLLAQRPAWFVQVNPDAPFPRWQRTEDPMSPGEVFGPIQEKGQAAKLVESIEDLFDLCRYYNILTQSPHGSACAYKDMGKCPAPCDGSVSMQQYRSLIDWSLATMRDPQTEIEQQQDRMKSAASDLRFETAGKIKQFVDQLSTLRKGDYRHVRPMRDFRYLSVQPGPRKAQVKLFSITPAGVECVACLRDEPKELLLRVPAIESLTRPIEGTAFDAESLGVAVRHLFMSKPAGVFLHGDDLTDRSLASAYKQLAKREPKLDETDDEGVVAELKPMTFSVTA